MASIGEGFDAGVVSPRTLRIGKRPHTAAARCHAVPPRARHGPAIVPRRAARGWPAARPRARVYARPRDADPWHGVAVIKWLRPSHVPVTFSGTTTEYVALSVQSRAAKQARQAADRAKRAARAAAIAADAAARAEVVAEEQAPRQQREAVLGALPADWLAQASVAAQSVAYSEQDWSYARRYAGWIAAGSRGDPPQPAPGVHAAPIREAIDAQADLCRVVVREPLAERDENRGGYRRASTLRRMHNGNPRLVTQKHLDAADRLGADYEVGHFGVRQGGGSMDRVDGATRADVPQRQLDALGAYRAACDAMGPSLRTVMQWVAVHGWARDRVARVLGITAEAASGYLVAGLDTLVEHYWPSVTPRVAAVAGTVDADVVDLPQERLGRVA